MAQADAIVSLSGVTRTYGRRAAVDRADLRLAPGHILGLLGESGSGKSTLLRTIAGLEPIDAGQIVIDGDVVSRPSHMVPPEARRVGMVFQDFALFPHLTVAQNVGFGLRDRSDRTMRVSTLLERVRLSDRAGAFPHTLSGGEQQRVALIRALARDPAVILLDEPFSSLDGSLRAEVREDLVQALRADGTSAIIVTHDAEDAMMMADDLALMRHGRVIQTGTPQACYDSPVSVAAARLLGPVNLLAAHIEGGVATSVLGQMPAALADGAGWMGVRPADLMLAEGSDAVAGQVVSVAYAGSHHMVRVAIDLSTCVVLQVYGPAPRIRETVSIMALPDRQMILPA